MPLAILRPGLMMLRMFACHMPLEIPQARECSGTDWTDVIILVIVRTFVVYSHILSASTSRRVD
jgi:hypothetical protein